MPATSPAHFATRGIIEGSYSVPYTHAQRTSMLTWMADHDLNTYIHAPKLDPYADNQWRTPYPAPAQADFAAEIGQANGLGISWVPAVHPGTDLCFSCPADRDVLAAKFQPFVTAGARTVMLGFDDLDTDSTTLPDRATYGTGPTARGTMTADLLNAMAARFPGVRVLTVLGEFSGTSSSPFLDSIAQHLIPAVDVFWTGPSTVSPTITLAQAQAIDAVLGRHVLVWDNFPVNDYSGWAGAERRLNLGPFEGLDPHLAGAVKGVLANVQSPWATNKVPMATLADYVADPTHYQPETSWRAALAAEGGTDAAALTTFAENSRSSPFDATESPVVGPVDSLGHDPKGVDVEPRVRLVHDRKLRLDERHLEPRRPHPAQRVRRRFRLGRRTIHRRVRAERPRRHRCPRPGRRVRPDRHPADGGRFGPRSAGRRPRHPGRRDGDRGRAGGRPGTRARSRRCRRAPRTTSASRGAAGAGRPTAAAAPHVLLNGLPTGVDFTVTVASGETLEVTAADPCGSRAVTSFSWQAS